ncbi:MAG: DUF2306 domain-containing protein [Pirellulales bacterium]
MIKVVGRLGFGMVLFLAFIGISSIVRRFGNVMAFLSDPAVFDVTRGGPPGATGFEARYYDHPYLTLVHIGTGLLFMVLGPLQFMPSIRNRWLGFHRWCGRIFLVASLVGVVTAVAFVPMLPVFGSLATQIGVVVASTYFMVALVQGYRHIRRREIAQHREWMIRLFALGLGISSFRLIVPLLMMLPLGATFTEAWDAAVWLGFVGNVTIAEVWINLTRPAGVRRHVPAPHGVAASTRASMATVD